MTGGSKPEFPRSEGTPSPLPSLQDGDLVRCPWVTPRDRKPQPGQCLGPCPPFTATHSRTQGLVAGEGGLPAPPARGDPALRAVLVSRAAPCPPGEAGALEPSALVPPRPTDTWWLLSAGMHVPGTAERGDGTRPAATRVPGARALGACHVLPPRSRIAVPST